MYLHSYVFLHFCIFLVDKCFFFMSNLGFLEIIEWEPWLVNGRGYPYKLYCKSVINRPTSEEMFQAKWNILHRSLSHLLYHKTTP